jgi:WD40 repeat protein
VTTGETSEAEERQQALCLMLEQQKAELDAQRLELRAEREEQTKMKATLQLQMEAQERTRRRVSEIAARNHGPPGTSMDCLLSQSMDLAEFANDAALASGGAPPNLVPVEQQLRACRDAISARAVESERLAARQRQLQREEADLHFRVAELQRYALRLALDPNSQVPQDLPPMPPPFVGETQFNTKPSDTSAALAYFSAVAATRTQHVHRTASGTMDEDGFYVVDPAGPNLSNSGGSGVTTVGSLGEAGDPVGTSAAVTSSGRKTGGYGARGEIGAADGTATAAATAAPATSKAPVDAIDSIGSRLAPTQVLELRKEVLDLRFVGYGGDSGGADAGDDQTPPSALMTATSDGCLRLFQAGARRPVAIIRGPKEGIAAVASVGVEAFVAAAGPGGYVARYDLAAGRELGALLAVPAEDGYEQTVSTSAPRRLQCVAAGGPGSGLVAAAGEGGDVYLWDSRVAPRGSRRTGGNTPAGAGSGSFGSAGVAPVMTLRVPGASSITSVSLARDGVTLAAIASNGARVFDLRAPASDRPARLASLEPGQRWACATHVGDEIFTTSTTGDVFAWQRKDDTGYGAPWKSARAHREACGFPGNGAADASTTSINTTDMSSRPAFAASAYAFGVDNKRVVLSASGSRGECVRAWDASSGDTIGEWGADGRSLDGAGASAAHQFREYGMNTGGHASVTAACWGSGAEGARFGKTSFAVGNAEGVVRVYGP